jgi:SAM-dependent methyltransferase
VSQFDAFARYYDADYGAFADDIPFYRELARRCDGPVLEVMCGSGRLLVPLALAGHQVAGVDVSAAMLALARGRLGAAGLHKQVELLEADIRERLPHGPFGLVIVALNSFMHLATTADQLAALKQIHIALRPGGLLAIDVYNPDPRRLVEHSGEVVFDKTFTLGDGAQVQKFVIQQADLATQIDSVTFLYDEIDPDGRVHRSVLPFTMRWLHRYELEHLLARAGFAQEALYGSYELDEYRGESEIMLVVARKT